MRLCYFCHTLAFILAIHIFAQRNLNFDLIWVVTIVTLIPATWESCCEFLNNALSRMPADVTMNARFHPRPRISCAEERLSLLLTETFAIVLSSGVPSSSWITWHKKGALSIWWKQIIKCISCVCASLQSHLAYCQGPIRFLWFYVPKIICSVVNGTRIFAVWLKKKSSYFLLDLCQA